MARNLSRKAYEKAIRSIPGGVNSPARTFTSVGAEPVFASSAGGAYLYDIDGNKYVDFIQSWGANILGHAHPSLTGAIRAAAEKGISFGLSTPPETELAELVKKAFPSIDSMRMVNSGTEAVMSAVRLARGYTGKNKIVKFEGGYHGHSDCLLAKAGSGLATFGIPGSPGVPDAIASETLVLPYNDPGAVKDTVKKHGDDIACILAEPIPANMGVVPPENGFLEVLREACNESGSVLIFDEVITGFRVAPGGAQQLFGVRPDLTTLGKIIGGGLPVGAFGGRREIMDCLAPGGLVYQAGTLSGNPVVVSAGIAVLKYLLENSPYEKLELLAGELEEGLKTAFKKAGKEAVINRVGSMFTVFFSHSQPANYSHARSAEVAEYGKFFSAMLDAGILFPPSQFEASFLSTQHSPGDIEAVLTAVEAWLRK